MKNNFFKYIFFVFAIGIIIFAIYKINKKEEIKLDEKSENVEENIEIVKELKLGIAEFDTINPIISKNKYVQDISRLIYNSLFMIDKEYKLQLDLAEEWAKLSTTEYIFKIKENMKWSDGTDLNAYDVLYTIDRLKESDSIYSYNVQSISEATVISENTLRVNLFEEVPFFEYNMIFPILSKEYYGEDNFFDTSKNDMPIGSGMFKISELQDGKIILVPNENWYGKAENNIVLEKIAIGKFSSIGELYNAFKLGQIDIINTTNIDIEQYIGSIGYNKKEYKGRSYTFLSFNCDNEILSSKEVRHAIKYAINKDEIIANKYSNKYFKTSFPLDYGSWLSIGDRQDEFDTGKTEEILVNNGWELINENWQKKEEYHTLRLNFKLIVKESELEIAENIKDILENIGIKITIVKVNDTQFNSYLENKNYEILLCTIEEGLTPDLSRYFSESNLANFITADSVNFINELKNITDENALRERYEKLRNIYLDEVPYISLFNNYSIVAYSNNLVGNVTPTWYNIFYDINGWHK